MNTTTEETCRSSFRSAARKAESGKSTLSRLVAREYANAGWRVKIAALDVSQGTSFNWQGRRLQSAIEPVVAVKRFGTVEQAVASAAQFDLMMVDAPPNSTAGTLRIARAADIVILLTGISPDDMQPSVLLAHELPKKGVSKAKIAFALCRVGDSDLKRIEAQTDITDAGYRVLIGSIPEKIAYRRPSDEGRAPTGTGFPTLNGRADRLARSIIDLVALEQLMPPEFDSQLDFLEELLKHFDGPTACAHNRSFAHFDRMLP